MSDETPHASRPLPLTGFGAVVRKSTSLASLAARRRAGYDHRHRAAEDLLKAFLR